MRNRIFVTGIVMAAALSAAACGGGSDSTAPAPQYQSIAGTYAGPMTGLDQGVAIAATITVTITQNAGSLGGSYGISGLLSDGVNQVSVVGSGSLNGTIAAGSNPSVNITVAGVCPGRTAQFSGAYDVANARLTLVGPVQIFAADCSAVLLTYQTTFILSH